MAIHNSNSRNLSIFQHLHLPEPDIQFAGYSALIKNYNLNVPLPDILSGISHKHSNYQQGQWMMYTPRHCPKLTLLGQLTFALKYEGINLLVLKALFRAVKADDIIKIVKLEPTGAYSRRIWFLYEWLMQKKLNIPDAKRGNYVSVLDPKLQYEGPTRLVKRQRLHDNLPGVPGFCPTIRKTEMLEKFCHMNLSQQIQTKLGSVHSDIIMRAAAFMLLKDSKASYAIEGETPPQNRAERWGQAIGQAGIHPLSHKEFWRLQQIVINDFRFTQPGYRNEGGFVGEHERSTGYPIPHHISARAKDIVALMDQLIETNNLLRDSDFDPVLAASIIAFGFVFIHPFEDGNGRIHRYLIHHVLASKHFTTKGLIFPVSAVILERISDYRIILESFSKPRLKLIDWKPTETGNVNVTNETIDLYSYYDATKQAEFLYECIKETIEVTLPQEVSYLKKHDRMKKFIINYIDMPDRFYDLLIRFLIQGNGKLSKRAKQKEFYALTQEEINNIEEKFAEIFLEA